MNKTSYVFIRTRELHFYDTWNVTVNPRKVYADIVESIKLGMGLYDSDPLDVA